VRDEKKTGDPQDEADCEKRGPIQKEKEVHENRGRAGGLPVLKKDGNRQ